MFTLSSFSLNDQPYHIRLLTHDYAEPLATMVREDFSYLSQFLPRPKPDFSTEDEIAFITQKTKEFAIGQSCVCVITDAKNNPLGVVDIHEYNAKSYRGEIGYRLWSKYQGKGIMTHALIHFADTLQPMWNFKKLSILAQHNNIWSNRVAQKAWFVFVCTLKQHIAQNGVLEDMNLYEKYWH